MDDAEVISTYTREDALEDGFLADVSAHACEVGFSAPVAITPGVHEEIAVPKGMDGWQDVKGRQHDVLWMAVNAYRGKLARLKAQGMSEKEMEHEMGLTPFKVIFQTSPRRKKTETLWLAFNSYKGRDRDLEESMTEAETRSRQKPFIPGRGAGYYQYVQGRGSKSDAELETEDRILINTIDLEKHKLETRNKRGKRAQSAVRKNFPKTNLARVRMKGDAEAVDSFYTAEREDGVKVNIHTRQMNGGKAADQIEQNVLEKEFARVSEWRDGRKVRLK